MNIQVCWQAFTNSCACADWLLPWYRARRIATRVYAYWALSCTISWSLENFMQVLLSEAVQSNFFISKKASYCEITALVKLLPTWLLSTRKWRGGKSKINFYCAWLFFSNRMLFAGMFPCISRRKPFAKCQRQKKNSRKNSSSDSAPRRKAVKPISSLINKILRRKNKSKVSKQIKLT